MLPPWAMITPSAPDFGHLDLGGHRVRLVLDVEDRVLRQAAHAAEEDLRVALDQNRPPGQCPGSAARRRGRRAAARCSASPRSARAAAARAASPASASPDCSPGSSPWSCRTAPRRRRRRRVLLADEDPRRLVPGHRGPAFVVDAAVAEHLEVLGLVPLGRLGVVERVQHADAFDRLLLDAVHRDRLGAAPPPRGSSARCR